MDPPAAIAHEPAALVDGVKLAERIDAVLKRRGALLSLVHAKLRRVAPGPRLIHGRQA
jgi:hypothetical protein